MKIFSNEKFRVALVSVLMIALGIVFCATPEKSLEAIEFIIAIGLIVVGLIYIMGFCFAPDFARESRILIIGILASALGILVIFIPSTLVLGIGLICGYAGLGRINVSINEKLSGDKSWWIELASGLVVFVVGLSLIVLRSTSLVASIIMIYMGVCLILFGIINLVLVFLLKREIRKIMSENNDQNDMDEGSSNTGSFTDFEVK